MIKNILKTLFLTVILTKSLFGQEVTLNKMLEVVSKIDSAKSSSNNKNEFQSILQWLETITDEVHQITGKDYRTLVKQQQEKTLNYIGHNVYTTNLEDINVKRSGKIGHLNQAFLLIVGDCDISFISNSIVFCTGNIKISHSDSNILIANGYIDISHDGGGPRNSGSIIYTREDVEIGHASNSVFLYTNYIDVSHMHGSDCINTKDSVTSHGVCRHFKSRLQEDYPKSKLYKIEEKNIELSYAFDTISKDSQEVAKYYFYGIKNLNFEYAINFIDLSYSDTFSQYNTFYTKNKMQRSKRKLKKW